MGKSFYSQKKMGNFTNMVSSKLKEIELWKL